MSNRTIVFRDSAGAIVWAMRTVLEGAALERVVDAFNASGEGTTAEAVEIEAGSLTEYLMIEAVRCRKDKENADKALGLLLAESAGQLRNDAKGA